MKNKLITIGAAVGVLLMTLTGCTDASIDVNVKEGGQANSRMSFEIDRKALDTELVNYGMNSESFLKDMELELQKTKSLSDTTEIKIIDTEKLVGYVLTSSGKVTENNQYSSANESIQLSKDNYIVNIPVYQILASITSTGEPKDIFSSFNVSVAFPGEVQKANFDGVIEGNKVTWKLDNVLQSIEEQKPLNATGLAKGNGLPLILILSLVGAILLIGAVIFVIVKKPFKTSSKKVTEKKKEHTSEPVEEPTSNTVKTTSNGIQPPPLLVNEPKTVTGKRFKPEEYPDIPEKQVKIELPSLPPLPPKKD